MPSTTDLQVAAIHSNPDNPRRDAESVETLVDSIRAQGVLQALTVAPHPELPEGAWIVIDGHRRHAAARQLGLGTVPCVVRDDLTETADQIAAMLATAREREPLTAAEEASGVQAMLDLGESVATIATRTGMSKTRVRQRAKVATLAPEILEKVHTHAVTLADAEFIATHTDYRDELERKIGTNDWAATKQRVTHNAERDAKVAKQLREAKALGIKQVGSYSTQYQEVADDHGVPVHRIEHVRNCLWDQNEVKNKTPEERALFYVRLFDYEQSVTLVQFAIREAEESRPAGPGDDETPSGDDSALASQTAADEARRRQAADEERRQAEAEELAAIRQELLAAKTVRIKFLLDLPATERAKWFGKLLTFGEPDDGWFINEDFVDVLSDARDGTRDEFLAVRDAWMKALAPEDFAWLSAVSMLVDDADLWLSYPAYRVDRSAAAVALEYVSYLRGMGHVFSDIENESIAFFSNLIAEADADAAEVDE